MGLLGDIGDAIGGIVGGGGGSSDDSGGSDSGGGGGGGGSDVGGGGGSGSSKQASSDVVSDVSDSSGGGGSGSSKQASSDVVSDVSDPSGGGGPRPGSSGGESGPSDSGGGGGGGGGSDVGGGGPRPGSSGGEFGPSGSGGGRSTSKEISGDSQIERGKAGFEASEHRTIAQPRIGDKMSGTTYQETPGTDPTRAVDDDFVDRQTGSGGLFASNPSDTSAVLPGSIGGVDISEQQLGRLSDAGEQAGDEIADTGSSGSQVQGGQTPSPLNSAFGREVADAGGRAVEGAAALPQQAETGLEFAQNAPLNAETAGTVAATAIGATKGVAESAVTDPVDFTADLGVGAITGTASLRGARAAKSAFPDKDSLPTGRGLPDRSIRDFRGSTRGQFDPSSTTQTVTKTEARDTTDFETVQTSDALVDAQTEQLLRERRIADQLGEQTDNANVVAQSEQLDDSASAQAQEIVSDRRDVGHQTQTAGPQAETVEDVLNFEGDTRKMVDDTTTGATQTAGVAGGIASTLTATETAGPSSDTLVPTLLSEDAATDNPPVVEQVTPTTTQTGTATATATANPTKTATETTTTTTTAGILGTQTATETEELLWTDGDDNDDLNTGGLLGGGADDALFGTGIEDPDDVLDEAFGENQ